MRVIICGYGGFAKELFDKYDIDPGDIACFAARRPDRTRLAEKYRDIPFLSWAQFHGKRPEADYAVICSVNYYDEVFREALSEFSPDRIIWAELWTRLRGYRKKERSSALTDILARTEALSPAALNGARVLPDREAALPLLPRGMTAAEIGVANGAFSRKILDGLQPKKFYAVDMFPENVQGFFGVDFGGKTHLDWYREKFSAEAASGLLEVRKGISWEVLEDFPDDSLDYVYVDAAHNYDSVCRDIQVLKRKVKKDGFLQFNDYTLYDYNSQLPYGVVPAVNRLVNETGSEVLYYCLSRNGFDDVVVRLKK